MNKYTKLPEMHLYFSLQQQKTDCSSFIIILIALVFLLQQAKRVMHIKIKDKIRHHFLHQRKTT